MTYREALTRAADQLSAHPELRATALPDAVLLLLHTLSIERATLIAHPERKLERDQQAAYQRLIERRLTFEPIQYILGTQEFYGLALRVTRAVLIPRPETELLVESVLKEANGDTSPFSQPDRAVSRTSLRILDVGTGSGAIAIALAHGLPHAEVSAVDISEEALAIARENALAHGLGNLRFQQSDLLAQFAVDDLFDIIVSNPPYIAQSDVLHRQVADYEPHLALFAGQDGLEIYRRLIPQAATHLRPGGLLALEIGHGQQTALAGLLSGWQNLTVLPDLQSIPRVILARNA